MIQRIFIWFYCLGIAEILLIIIVANILYFLLRDRLSNNDRNRFWSSAKTLLLFAWISIIILGTLTGRVSSTVTEGPSLIPFHSYCAVIAGGNKEILRSNFMNVILFYPAGLLACDLLPKNWCRSKRIILISVLLTLFSVGIEFCQYSFALGHAEVDDVIHNALGALIGSLVCTSNGLNNFGD